MLFTSLLIMGSAVAQSDSLRSDVLNSLLFRLIGPATTSGRISDIAVNPKNHSEYYIAAAYGGVWKTVNAGVTFEPIFDNYGTQSIGCLAIDNKNTNTIWVGTGENNNQRSVGYGNGIYKSVDGGKSFVNMGLKNSERIGMIAIHPANSDVIFVAAYGSVWKSGGERGIYKSSDGGKSWERVHFVDDNTGCNEVYFDAENPEIMYAAYHQRRRHEWTYIGGGPQSAVYKSVDGGKSWKKLSGGLPSGDLGRIALAVPPANPDKIYAMVEANGGSGGMYVSNDKGESWVKMNGSYTAGNYYQEIIPDPKDENRVFIMDTWLQWTKDGGRTVSSVGEKWKHVDNHAMWINPNNTKHWLVGCDGGLYETFDEGQNWAFKENLSITQFYRASVDNAEPFYNIYGGTQDNNTLGGPSANGSANGIRNSEWFVTVGGDGFKSQIDPSDPNIVYSQWQYGGLIRFDRKTGEQIDIKPITGLDEEPVRWNWDAPLIVSHHQNSRLYFAANKIFRSDDRGQSWKAISGDLSRGIDRNKLPVMDRVWGMDAVAKNQSVSIYGNITYLAESPLDENILYAGTDDGLLQITTDGGKTWNKIGKFPGIPDMAYITAIVASQYDKNTVIVAFDNHRNGDFLPYILESKDAGKTWKSISSNLPKNGSVKCIAQDFVSPELLFAGTEFGFFVSKSGGKSWTQWNAGLPPIAIKDIAIQKRENDLVLATFGRGFAVIDNYSALREMNSDNLNKDFYVFGVKKAKMFIPRSPLGGRGNAFKGAAQFSAPNPASGAVLRFYVKNDYKTMKDLRVEREKKLAKEGKNTYYPSIDTLKLEQAEEQPYILCIISGVNGEVRRLKAAARKGMNTIEWDLRYGSTNPYTFSEPDLNNPYADPDFGPFVAPGKYTAQLYLVKDKNMTAVGNNVQIECDYLYQPTLKGMPEAERTKAVVQISELRRNIASANEFLSETRKSIGYISRSITSPGMPADVIAKVAEIRSGLEKLNTELNGDRLIASLEKETKPGIYGLLETAVYGLSFNTSGPTATHMSAVAEAEKGWLKWKEQAVKVDEQMKALEKMLDDNKVPYTPGRRFFLN